MTDEDDLTVVYMAGYYDAKAKYVGEIERLRAALRLITQTAPFGQPQGIAREVLGEPWKPSNALMEKE